MDQLTRASINRTQSTPPGCIEISNLCSNQYYGELLREAGAIEAVIDAIFRFPNSLRVQFAAVQAIANLSAGSNEARLRLGAAGAGRVLVQCLVRFSQDQVHSIVVVMIIIRSTDRFDAHPPTHPSTHPFTSTTPTPPRAC